MCMWHFPPPPQLVGSPSSSLGLSLMTTPPPHGSSSPSARYMTWQQQQQQQQQDVLDSAAVLFPSNNNFNGCPSTLHHGREGSSEMGTGSGMGGNGETPSFTAATAAVPVITTTSTPQQQTGRHLAGSQVTYLGVPQSWNGTWPVAPGSMESLSGHALLNGIPAWTTIPTSTFAMPTIQTGGLDPTLWASSNVGIRQPSHHTATTTTATIPYFKTMNQHPQMSQPWPPIPTTQPNPIIDASSHPPPTMPFHEHQRSMSLPTAAGPSTTSPLLSRLHSSQYPLPTGSKASVPEMVDILTGLSKMASANASPRTLSSSKKGIVVAPNTTTAMTTPEPSPRLSRRSDDDDLKPAVNVLVTLANTAAVADDDDDDGDEVVVEDESVDDTPKQPRYVGIFLDRSRWAASIVIGGVKRRLGRFDTRAEAAMAYDRAVLENKLDRPLNFPIDGDALVGGQKTKVKKSNRKGENHVPKKRGRMGKLPPPTCLYRGVHSFSGRWKAQIWNGKTKYLGMFETAEEAGMAYDVAAREIFGPHAVLNFPSEDDLKGGCRWALAGGNKAATSKRSKLAGDFYGQQHNQDDEQDEHQGIEPVEPNRDAGGM